MFNYVQTSGLEHIVKNLNCKYENPALFAAFLYPDNRNNFMGAPVEPYAFVKFEICYSTTNDLSR